MAILLRASERRSIIRFLENMRVSDYIFYAGTHHCTVSFCEGGELKCVHR